MATENASKCPCGRDHGADLERETLIEVTRANIQRIGRAMHWLDKADDRITSEIEEGGSVPAVELIALARAHATIALANSEMTDRITEMRERAERRMVSRIGSLLDGFDSPDTVTGRAVSVDMDSDLGRQIMEMFNQAQEEAAQEDGEASDDASRGGVDTGAKSATAGSRAGA